MAEIPDPLSSTPTGEAPGIAELYRAAVDSFVEFARSFDHADWATPVPCTPGWTCRDVLSHVAGIPDDAFAGRMDGAPGPAWTAAQVERNAALDASLLLDRWAGQADEFGALLEQVGQSAPPVDCYTHEQDLRHALGRPGNRDHPIVDAMASSAGASLAHVPARLTIRFDDGLETTVGTGGPEVGLVIHRFDYLRSRLGRRSRAQLAAAEWTGDPAAVAAVQDAWWIFGTADTDIVE